jgi:hypothetical protein
MGYLCEISNIVNKDRQRRAGKAYRVTIREQDMDDLIPLATPVAQSLGGVASVDGDLLTADFADSDAADNFAGWAGDSGYNVSGVDEVPFDDDGLAGGEMIDEIPFQVGEVPTELDPIEPVGYMDTAFECGKKKKSKKVQETYLPEDEDDVDRQNYFQTLLMRKANAKLVSRKGNVEFNYAAEDGLGVDIIRDSSGLTPITIIASAPGDSGRKFLSTLRALAFSVLDEFDLGYDIDVSRPARNKRGQYYINISLRYDVEMPESALEEGGIYTIGGGGMRRITGNEIRIQPNHEYWLGASSSPTHIIVTKVDDDWIYFRYAYNPLKGERRENRLIGTDLIATGTSTWVKSGYAKYYPELARALKLLLAGKPSPLKTDWHDYIDIDVAVGPSTPDDEGDFYGVGKAYGVISNDPDGSYFVRLPRNRLEDLKAEPGIKVGPILRDPAPVNESEEQVREAREPLFKVVGDRIAQHSYTTTYADLLSDIEQLNAEDRASRPSDEWNDVKPVQRVKNGKRVVVDAVTGETLAIEEQVREAVEWPFKVGDILTVPAPGGKRYKVEVKTIELGGGGVWVTSLPPERVCNFRMGAGELQRAISNDQLKINEAKEEAWVWMRMDNYGEYEQYDSPGEAASALAERVKLSVSTSKLDINDVIGDLRWITSPVTGLQIYPFELENYVSLFWGDEDAQQGRPLSRKEQADFIKALRSNLKESANMEEMGYKDEFDGVLRESRSEEFHRLLAESLIYSVARRLVELREEEARPSGQGWKQGPKGGWRRWNKDRHEWDYWQGDDDGGKDKHDAASGETKHGVSLSAHIAKSIKTGADNKQFISSVRQAIKHKVIPNLFKGDDGSQVDYAKIRKMGKEDAEKVFKLFARQKKAGDKDKEKRDAEREKKYARQDKAKEKKD